MSVSVLSVNNGGGGYTNNKNVLINIDNNLNSYSNCIEYNGSIYFLCNSKSTAVGNKYIPVLMKYNGDFWESVPISTDQTFPFAGGYSLINLDNEMYFITEAVDITSSYYDIDHYKASLRGVLFKLYEEDHIFKAMQIQTNNTIKNSSNSIGESIGFNNKIFHFGLGYYRTGSDGGKIYTSYGTENKSLVWDKTTNTWSDVPFISTTAYNHGKGGVCIYNNKIHLLGGYYQFYYYKNGSSSATNNLYYLTNHLSIDENYNVEELINIPLSNTTPYNGAITVTTACVHKNKIHVIIRNEHFEWDDTSSTWTSLNAINGMYISLSTEIQMFSFNNNLYLITSDGSYGTYKHVQFYIWNETDDIFEPIYKRIAY